MAKQVKVTAGAKGWGGPLVLEKSGTRTIVASIIGGGIHPVAAKIAELLDAEVKDGFSDKVEPEEMICVVIDCGGTARTGVYPKLNVPTLDVHGVTPSGPLARYITKENFVSGVTPETVVLTSGETASAPAATATKAAAKTDDAPATEQSGIIKIINSLGRAVGNVVSIFYQAGRDTIDMVIRNIIPFMAFVSVIVGFISYSGAGTVIANALTPMTNSLVGLLIISVVCAIPFLSPVLGPGAVIAQIVGVLLGVEIGKGNIKPSMALPALMAINPQVGCDFVPVGLTLAESKPYTVQIGVPAVLFSRLITGPISVIIAYLLSFGLY